MKEKIINILKLLTCFISFYFIGEILIFILNLFGIDITKLSETVQILLQFIASLIMFVLLLITYRKYIKEEFIILKKNKEKTIGDILKMFIVFMTVKYVVGIISVLILEFVGLDVNSLNSVNQVTIENYAKVSPFVIFLSSSILAPIYEELLFRMGIKKVIKNKYIFIIVSGSIFGLLHIFPLSEEITLTLGLIQSITYVTMGIFLAYVYEKTGNIFNSIGIHFLNNLLSILVLINSI